MFTLHVRDVIYDTFTHPCPLSHVWHVCYDTMRVLKRPVRLLSLLVRHKGISDSSQPLYTSSSNCAQGTWTSVLHHFRLYDYVTLVVFHYLLDSRYRWFLLRNSRMLYRPLLYVSNPWTLTNGVRSSVQSGLRRNMKENFTHYQRRRQYCGKHVLVKTLRWHFLGHWYSRDK